MTHRLFSMLLGALLLLAACTLETEDARCPCLPGHTCCATAGTCVREGEPCPSAAPRRWTRMESGSNEHLVAIWGSSLTNIHVGGYNGTLLHYDGSGWSPMPSPTTALIRRMRGVDRSHVLAVGENGTVLYYKGTLWAPMDPTVPNSINDLWGSSFEDVFAVGTGGTILHFDGTAWSPMNGPTEATMYGIWGADSRHVFAIAVDGSVLRWDGVVWSRTASGGDPPMRWVWGRGPSDVFLSGDFSVLLHFDGSAWTPAGAGVPRAAVTYQACGDDREMFIVGELDPVYAGEPGQTGTFVYHHDGTRWEQLDPGTSERLDGVWCLDGKVFVVGHYGTILRYAL